MDPLQEYEARMARWTLEAERHDERHLRAGNWNLLIIAALLGLVIFLRNLVPVGLLIAGLIAGIFTTAYLHDRILAARDAARQMAGFYRRGLDRLRGQWMGKGSPGTEFLDREHPYAADLDIFGPGSVFELLDTTQTQSGKTRLAQWLANPSTPENIALRQGAVKESSGKVGLQEKLAASIILQTAQIRTAALLAWANAPAAPASPATRFAMLFLPIITWSLLAMGQYRLYGFALLAQIVLSGMFKKRTTRVVDEMKTTSKELFSLANLIECLEGEKFESARLRQLQLAWKIGGGAASLALRRVAKTVDWMNSDENKVLAVLGPLVLLKTQLGFMVEKWRVQHGKHVAGWLDSLGEMETIFALGAYTFEHPSDVMPEISIDTRSPEIEAEGLGHPLLPEGRSVRNDAHLSAAHPFIVISGSNMSGKSTWMRSVGTNLVLAMAGAPVRARKFRATPMMIGASMRTADSLQDGISRFYAEIKRLRQIADLTEKRAPVLFLIDEVLSGTNSHDRRIGAAHIAKMLVRHGAIGMMTTHDLALTEVASEVNPPGANFHFEDQFADGKLLFDYKLRPGVVEKSNALALMRSIGFDLE